MRQAERAGRNVLCMKMRHWNTNVSIVFISGRTGVHEECFLTIAVCPYGSVLELGKYPPFSFSTLTRGK